MTDEQLLIMYRKYKVKRRIIITFLLLLVISLCSYLIIRNTSSKDKIIDSNTNIIKDEVAPEIKLNATSIEIMKGGDIDYSKYVISVIDNVDGDLSNKISYTKIDTSIVEEQIVVYTVSDSSGNTSKEVLKVKILEEEKQEIPEVIPPKQETPKKEETKPSTNSSIPNNSETQTNPTIPSNNESTNNKSPQKIVKYFLFEDGYTMSNVSEVCATELKKTNRTGMCSPIQDENGIYLGMKLVVE